MLYSNFKNWLLRVSLLYVLCGCGASTTSHYQKETGIFNRYLKTTRFTIDSNKSYLFICTPACGCAGCDERLFNTFSDTKNNHVLLLTSSKEFIFNTLSLKSRTYFDSTGKLDKINLPIRNASVIFYEKGRISDIASVNPNAPDSINYKINAWLKEHRD